MSDMTNGTNSTQATEQTNEQKNISENVAGSANAIFGNYNSNNPAPAPASTTAPVSAPPVLATERTNLDFIPQTVYIYLHDFIIKEAQASEANFQKVYQRFTLWLSRQPWQVNINIQGYCRRFWQYDSKIKKTSDYYNGIISNKDSSEQEKYQAKKNLEALEKLNQLFTVYKAGDAVKLDAFRAFCWLAAIAFYRDNKKNGGLQKALDASRKINKSSLEYKICLPNVMLDIEMYRREDEKHKPLSWKKIAQLLPMTHKKLFKDTPVSPDYLRKVYMDTHAKTGEYIYLKKKDEEKKDDE